jgi:hypothetical protein
VLLDATTEHFVLRVKDIKYCPHPDCVGVVKFNPLECRHNLEIRDDVLETVGAVCTASGEHGNDAPLTYEGVGDPAYGTTNRLLLCSQRQRIDSVFTAVRLIFTGQYHARN